MLILAVDPSVNNLGLAAYDTETEKLRTRNHHPVRSFAKAGESQSMVYLGHSALRYILIDFLQGKRIEKLIIEYPQWENSQRGLIAMQKGYIHDLAFLTGILACGFGLASNSVYTPTPRMWKGNMPKTATKSRVQKHFGTLQISEHEYDAAGLILWGMKQPGIAEAIPG